MVYLTRILLRKTKRLKKGFVDSLRLTVTGGTGGSGQPRYGGLGGNGGNVYVVAKEGRTLYETDREWNGKKIKGGTGDNSTKIGLLGKSGSDVHITAPTGITVYTEDGINLGEINEDGSEVLAAKGGLGGCPQTDYCGEKGQTRTIVLDLKLIADVGLVGFPNAGKSTFLKAISAAKPKIANYPFTTLRPQLGIVEYKDHRQIRIADLPGLIEDAHANVGLGHKFLKHIERTKLLLFIVDIQGFQLSMQHLHRSCLETIVLLNKELELYKPDLINMPAMLIINKMDTENADDIYQELKLKLKRYKDCCAEVSEDIRPERAIEFEQILTASLKLEKKEEIKTIKETIRNIIDKYEEVPDQNLDENLMEKLKQQTRLYTPTLT